MYIRILLLWRVAMFRTMRLQGNMTTVNEAEDMLKAATNGVLAVNGDDGYPYAVPVSYVYENGKIYFHSTSESSHKVESIKNNPKVSFCVVTQDNILPEAFNTLYRSVIAFGKAKVLTDQNEIEKAIMTIVRKYSGGFIEEGKAYMHAESGNFCVVEIDVEHMTGKAGS